MPCQSHGESDHGWQESADAATRAACDLRTILRRGGTEADLCVSTREWITQHDKEDAERKREEEATNKRERRKRAALDKLTLDERRVLGL
jgi:hypothetical protein